MDWDTIHYFPLENRKNIMTMKKDSLCGRKNRRMKFFFCVIRVAIRLSLEHHNFLRILLNGLLHFI